MINGIIIQRAREAVIISYANGIDITLYAWQLIVIASVAVAFALTVYLLMGFGLHRMAKLRGIGNAWLGFVPFARLYLLGQLAGESRFFGWKIKNAGILAMSLTMATFLLDGFCKVVQYLPIYMILREGGTVVFEASAKGLLELSPVSGSFEWSQAMLVVYQVFNYLDYFLSLALIFVNVMLYMDLFKKYAPAHYLLYSLLAVLLPIGGIFVFCLRNKPAVNFGDYIKERYMRMQGTFMGDRPTPPDNPFREFGGRGDNDPGDPFGEFSDGKSRVNKNNESNDDDPFGGFGGGSDGDGN